jgi:uncharacterized protein YyaL (SSP411 family)
MPNRLATESSPYLLQHANNPVDWYPWSEEALAQARAEDKPIFLSVGYSACHWCHVMEHESFENPETAALMNELFVNIKVDREERPDLDSIYMDAVVAMTGQGGWPMSVFLTPDGLPFYGGTYYPPTPRHGMPSFEQVLRSIAHAYHNQREEVLTNGKSLAAHIEQNFLLQSSTTADPAVIDQAVRSLSRQFDGVQGGFSGAPKFPQPMTYDFLLRAYHHTPKQGTLQMVELTLLKMGHGGIYDQLGGGFHRYSVDAIWLVPHFEKMLYDNALLARLYLHTYQLTGKPFYRKIVEETLDYVMREMTDPAGGFYSTQDADSEGEEGKFFLWTPTEIEAVLGTKDAELFCAAYDVTSRGNFEGKSILNIPTPLTEIAEKFNLSPAGLNEKLEECKQTLFKVREKRIKPARDEKIVTAWNGMMLATFAEAARVLDRPDYLATATKNADFVLSTMLHAGRLFRTWKADPGKAKLAGYLEDYAFYADGLLALYQTTFDPKYFQYAQQLMAVVLKHFVDADNGGFFDTADDHEKLVTRPKSVQDNAIPCGNSMAVRTLLHLAAYTGDAQYQTPALEALAALQEPMAQYPAAFAYWLGSLAFTASSPKEIALVGPRQNETAQQMLRLLRQPYYPAQVVAAAEEEQTSGHPPLLHHRPARNGQPTVYVCQSFVCNQPVVTPDALAGLLDIPAEVA